jgi:hypothetical protein
MERVGVQAKPTEEKLSLALQTPAVIPAGESTPNLPLKDQDLGGGRLATIEPHMI